MNSTLNDFLTFFNLTELTNISGSTTVSELISLIILSFFAFAFSAIGIKFIMEFIKILLDYRRFR